jgi:hypothetical protein
LNLLPDRSCLKDFIFQVENIQTKLGVKTIHRKIHESKSRFELRKDQILYTAVFSTENGRLRQENT